MAKDVGRFSRRPTKDEIDGPEEWRRAVAVAAEGFSGGGVLAFLSAEDIGLQTPRSPRPKGVSFSLRDFEN